MTADGKAGQMETFATDQNGSLRADLVLPSTFGVHSIRMQGSTSGVNKTNSINLPATMTLTHLSLTTPTSG